MLTEQRYELILRLLEDKKSITVAEVRDLLRTSESTVRRDITALDKAGKLTKVFGGAVAKNYQTLLRRAYGSSEAGCESGGEEAGSQIRSILDQAGDFVYLDAGTTTGMMLDYLLDDSVTYVTDGVAHAQRLVKKGMKVILLGGELKASTEAVIGTQAVQMLMNYHFTKGFFGTNGITQKTGFTTPDINEAAVKSVAMEQCKECYIVTDSSKFDLISPVSFSTFYGGTILTDRIVSGYEACKHIIKVP